MDVRAFGVERVRGGRKSRTRRRRKHMHVLYLQTDACGSACASLLYQVRPALHVAHRPAWQSSCRLLITQQLPTPAGLFELWTLVTSNRQTPRRLIKVFFFSSSCCTHHPQLLCALSAALRSCTTDLQECTEAAIHVVNRHDVCTGCCGAGC